MAATSGDNGVSPEAARRGPNGAVLILLATAVGGGAGYLLQIVTRDIDAYQRLIDAMLDARIGLARYFTYVVTKPVKGLSPPPLEALLAAE